MIIIMYNEVYINKKPRAPYLDIVSWAKSLPYSTLIKKKNEAENLFKQFMRDTGVVVFLNYSYENTDIQTCEGKVFGTNVSQGAIVSSGDTIQFGNQEFNILDPNEVQKNEKNVINLPIQKNNSIKNASLNIFKNSTQQAISSPAVFRNVESDTYITIKVIDDDNFKLIFRKNYGIFIIWLGLAISSLSFISRLKR